MSLEVVSLADLLQAKLDEESIQILLEDFKTLPDYRTGDTHDVKKYLRKLEKLFLIYDFNLMRRGIMNYIVEREIRKFIDAMALTNISGFYPSLIIKKFNVSLIETIKILEKLEEEGLIYKKFIVINPEYPFEKKEFSHDELPLGEYYDEFQFGDEIFISEDIVSVMYKFVPEIREQLKKKIKLNA